ncbi:rifin [Plasmodium falciparum RAJ116]|uniref:Rifin n=1 Tax=Plasmodium falciparum RAJ116 TaxID=580058 RepID=A0A0L0CYK0_PLAFA|nr:rifin [Plasmodium falciparum RAJ116]
MNIVAVCLSPLNRCTPRHIQTTRLLCECELYMSNYDNDPEMKRVMQQFHDRTTQRFQEYDEGLQEKRQICKDKYKIEKELNEKFSALHTDIQSDDIPTCICEKSLADKVERGCLRCGSILGAAMPEVGSLGGCLLYALNQWSITATASAKAAAAKAAGDAATEAGMKAVVSKINELIAAFPNANGLFDLTKIVTSSNYNCGPSLVESAMKLITEYNTLNRIDIMTSFQNTATMPGKYFVGDFAKAGSAAYDEVLPSKIAAFEKTKLGAVDATYTSFQTSIIAPIITIVVIVLIMVIIYLILRYRRKKKMKKKLQYIKLLEE